MIFYDKTERELKERFNSMPGIGNTGGNTFRTRVHFTSSIDASIVREQAMQNVVQYMQKELVRHLQSLPMNHVSFRELLMLPEGAILAGPETVSLLMAEDDWVSRADGGLRKFGKHGVHVVQFMTGNVFLVRENVISILSVSEGRGHDHNGEYILIEGSYSIHSSDKNLSLSLTR